jgi:hypothetical protein
LHDGTRAPPDVVFAGTSVQLDERSVMRSDARRQLQVVEPQSDHVACSRCDRTVDSDVMAADELLAVLGWSRIDGQVLCVACQREVGRPADLVGRILARL